MLKSRQLNKSKSIALKSSFKKMEEKLKLHPSWRSGVSMLEAQEMLRNQPSFTYMLSEGLDKYHYILNYVGADQQVHFKNVRILYVNGVPIYKNGGGGVYENIADLVPSCLKCSADTCIPL